MLRKSGRTSKRKEFEIKDGGVVLADSVFLSKNVLATLPHHAKAGKKKRKKINPGVEKVRRMGRQRRKSPKGPAWIFLFVVIRSKKLRDRDRREASRK